MVRINRSYRIQVCSTKDVPQWRAPLGFSTDRLTGTDQTPRYAKSPSRSSSSLREPDRRRRNEERLSRSEQRTGNKPKIRLDRKSPIQVRIRFPPPASLAQSYSRSDV